MNACAALAAAILAGVAPEAAAAALPSARPGPHRLELVQLPDAVTLLDDCYNASPSSMQAALETLRQGAQGRRRGAILGDMLELGPDAPALHREVGRACHGTGLVALLWTALRSHRRRGECGRGSGGGSGRGLQRRHACLDARYIVRASRG